ncbi:MAG TPA: GatB/YqeY domain-containing protein [Burkholderiaceae bacterium]|nr:GatB/YqeY domain-containing protein [Burkholderiaceae bacterium]
MPLKDQVNEDMKAAMRARDALTLSSIRLLLAAIKQREIDQRVVLDDDAVLAVVDKLIKQRRESIAQFAAAGREDLADKERAELAVLERYLPQQLSAAEVDAAIAAAIAEVRAAGGAGPQAMGKVMAILKPRLAGRADMGQVSARVKALVSAS